MTKFLKLTKDFLLAIVILSLLVAFGIADLHLIFVENSSLLSGILLGLWVIPNIKFSYDYYKERSELCSLSAFFWIVCFICWMVKFYLFSELKIIGNIFLI